jgi:hypothetical protein
VLVAAGFFVAGMVGWRLLVMGFARWRNARPGVTI